ncbi:ubiquitin carboxyl-terminal hydrolase 12A-like isoform X2 [Stigmatopora argus]
MVQKNVSDVQVDTHDSKGTISSKSSNGSDVKPATRPQHKCKIFRWWPCCMKFSVFPETHSPRPQRHTTSSLNMVKESESLLVKKKVLHVSFQENNKTTGAPCHPDLEQENTNWGPKENTANIQKPIEEKSKDFVQGDLIPTNKKKSNWLRWLKRCQVGPKSMELCNLRQNCTSSNPDSTLGLDCLASCKKLKKKYNEWIASSSIKSPSLKRFKLLGFPNPAQICYMNASLQSLLTLKDFVEDISCQESIWSLNPDATLIRSFMNIRACHSSSNIHKKINCLYSFKNAVSLLVPEFQDFCQKDAHEFLTSVLNQIRNLNTVQQKLAIKMGKTYKCPVEEHFVFKMQNIRMCLSCNYTFTREEEFTNLSLDLLPGFGTVKEMLHNYLKKTQVEYKCECGSTTSLQNSSFISLPRVLVLHLKRFVFFSVFGSIKIQWAVQLSKNLVLPSKQGYTCYSLVSIINHSGFTTSSGHYITDGVDPAMEDNELTDRWFTYNDLDVQETSLASVCEKRQTTAYVLFYRRLE